MLDKLFGPLTFDPHAFTRMKPKEQLDLLKQLVGLDFSGLEAKHKEIYEKRTSVGYEKREKKAQFDGIAIDGEAPDAEVDVAELAAEMRRLDEANREIDSFALKVERADEVSARWEQNLERLDSDILDLEEKLAAMRRQRESVTASAEQARAEADAARHDLQTMARRDTSELAARMQQAGAINERVRAKRQASLLWDQYLAADEKYDELSAELEAIEEEKRTALSTAAMPVAGLSFDENQVLYNGLPYSQICTSDQLRVSVAIGLALNPQLPLVIIRDWSLLDTDSRKLVVQMVQEHGAQAACEMVGEGEECTVIIEDGSVRGAVPQEVAA